MGANIQKIRLLIIKKINRKYELKNNKIKRYSNINGKIRYINRIKQKIMIRK